MADTLVRIYDDLEHAENARNELLHAGFQSSRMHLSVRDDESGPAEGNFTVGNDTHHHEKGVMGYLKSLIDSTDEDYDATYRHTVQRATYMLTIDTEDEDETLKACEITAKHGALPTDNGTCSGNRAQPQ